MNVILQGTNLELTDTLRSYVEDKIRDAFRVFGAMDLEPVEVAVELEKASRRRRQGDRLFRAEAIVTVPGRRIRVEAASDDVYRAVVQLKHALAREIRTWRERLIDARRKGARAATELSEEPSVPDSEAVDLEDLYVEEEHVAEEAWAAWVPDAEPAVEAEEDLPDLWEETGEDERDNV